MDPRLGLLVVLSTSFSDAIPEIGHRVDVMRIEPVWGDDEIPIIFIDFDDEQRELHIDAPRQYKHTLPFSIYIYCRGRGEKSWGLLLDIIAKVEAVMREWQYILPSDVTPDAPDDECLIDEIRAGDAINYFKSMNAGNEDHQAARIAYEAEFYTSGASFGTPRKGMPSRNRLAEFLSMQVQWDTRPPKGASAIDRYPLSSTGGFDANP